MKATRDGYGRALLELGRTDPRVVVLTADLKESTKVEEFANVFPDRFIECGVAEQNMMGIAAGLAAAGKVPFVSSYAVFSPGRSWDQLRVSVAYSNLPVVIVGGHTGLGVGPDGATHQALEDIAITRVLPNMKVVVPCDYNQAYKATIAAAASGGPVYLRMTREKTAGLTAMTDKFVTGKADIMWNSAKSSNIKNQIVIAGCGPILHEILLAARELHDEGTGTIVINNHTIKPADRETIIGAVSECGGLVTVEDHQIMGGMGSAIVEVLVAHGSWPVEMVGVKDTFGESGTAAELLEKYGIGVKSIKEAAKKVVKRKEKFSA